jgi:hypothetical protein
MGAVTYNTKRLVPAPLFLISKENQGTGDLTKVGTLYNITINGVVLSWKGSPRADGSFYTGAVGTFPPDDTVADADALSTIERKKEAIRQLFATDGLTLTLQSDGGSTPITCNPRIRSVTFAEGTWYSELRYTIVCEADVLYGLSSLNDERFNEYISTASESWAVQEQDVPKTFQVTHTLSATGKRFYTTSGTVDLPAWKYAQLYVIPRLGFNALYINQSTLSSGVVSLSGVLTPYDIQRTESIDDLAGSFSVTETWTLASGTAIEDYSIKVNHNIEDSKRSISANIDGSIKGNWILLSDHDTAYNNAFTEWGRVRNILPTRMAAYASGLNFVNGTVTYDRIRGNINYAYEYDNRPVTSGTFEEYSVSVKNDFTDYRWTANIDGKIMGVIADNEDDLTLKFTRADLRWQTVKGLLFNRILIYATGVQNLKPTPIASNYTKNPIEGSVQYSYAYNNRIPEAAFDDFQVSRRFSRDQGFNTVNVQGLVTGYDLTGSGIILERYNNASAAFPDEGTLFSRAQTYATGITINNIVINREITRSPQAGTIGYSVEYSSEPLPCFSGALSEYIVVIDRNPGNIVAQLTVPGRSQGPLLQDIQTYTARIREINMELVMPTFSGLSCDYMGGYNTKPNTQVYLDRITPTGTYQLFKVGDTENWDWRRGRYSRQTEFLYEI